MSSVPADPVSYRCDRLAEDVDALREHLGLDRFDLLGHSAGANVAAQYAAKYQGRLGKLALVTPSGRAVGLAVDDEARHEILNLRQDEPWFAEAAAAFERGGETADDWRAIAPFCYGRWDSAAQVHWSAEETQESDAAARGFGADGAFDPVATRAGIAALGVPVLVLAGGIDPIWPPRVVGDFAAMFPAATFVVQPGAGHYPWLDDARWFVATVTEFLDGACPQP
jgi:pimeloyl-ACP methyl ester carboxylesterase